MRAQPKPSTPLTTLTMVLGALALFLSACLVATPAVALIIDVDHVDDVCDPAEDPCVIGERVVVVDGTTLDFGLRAVEVRDGAQIDIDTGTVTLLCGGFSASNVLIAVKARGASDVLPGGTDGGSFTMEVRGGCSDAPTTPCLVDADCGGTCSAGDGTIDLGGRIVADGNIAGQIVLRAAGDVIVADAVQAHGTRADSDAGTISVSSGTGSIFVRARIAGASGTLSRGADITLAAAVDIVLESNLNADGGLAGGGTIDLQVGNDLVANADINASSVESGGSGGQVSITTGRDILVCNGCKVLLNGHFGRGGGGDGGTLTLDAGRDFVVGRRARLAVTAANGSGDGGTATVTTAGDIDFGGRLFANVQSLDGVGGTVLFDSEGTIDFSGAAARIEARGGNLGGGSITLDAVGDITFGGKVSVQARRSADAGNVTVVSATGDIVVGGGAKNRGIGTLTAGIYDFSACDVTVETGAYLLNRVDSGQMVLTAREQLTLEAASRVQADRRSGTFTLIHRDGGPVPIVSGRARPTPTIVAQPLAACP